MDTVDRVVRLVAEVQGCVQCYHKNIAHAQDITAFCVCVGNMVSRIKCWPWHERQGIDSLLVPLERALQDAQKWLQEFETTLYVSCGCGALKIPILGKMRKFCKAREWEERTRQLFMSFTHVHAAITAAAYIQRRDEYHLLRDEISSMKARIPEGEDNMAPNRVSDKWDAALKCAMKNSKKENRPL